MEFAVIDWFIVGIYAAIVVAIGLAFRRRAGRSLEEYFVSGRSLPWWLAGTSMVATTFAADTPLAVTGLVVKHGLAGNWLWWSLAMGGMLTVFVFARYWRRAEVITDVELIALRYSGKPARALRTIRALYWALLVNPIIVGWVCGGMLTVLEEAIFFQAPETAQQVGFWGRPDVLAWVTLLSLFGFTALYSALSGLWGVVVTDAIQFAIAMAGCIWLAVAALDHAGGSNAMLAQVEERFTESGSALSFWPNFQAANPWMPLHIFLIIVLVQWWTTCYPGAEPGGGGYIVQRMSSCRSERDSILAALWFQLAHYCLRPWPWIIVAFFALATFPELRADYVADPTVDPGKGYAQAMRLLARPGLTGIVAVAFFSAFMSTISTQINWAASYLVRDVLQPWSRGDWGDRQIARASKWVSWLIVLISLGFAVWMRGSGVSVDEAWQLLMALGAGTGLFLMLRWFWWRVNAWTEIAAMGFALIFYGLTRQDFVWQALGRDQPFANSEQIALVSLGTIVGCLGVMLLTRPDDPEVLRSFYRRVRPWPGGWGPIARLEPDVDSDRTLGLGLVGAVSGSALIYFTLPFIGKIIFPGMPVSLVICGSGMAVSAAVAGWVTWRLTSTQRPSRT